MSTNPLSSSVDPAGDAAKPKGANARQEGGVHYGLRQLQHWDVVVMFDLDYFQGQISKYVFRWRDKQPTLEQKIVELKKARHFLDKYIEEVEAGNISAESRFSNLGLRLRQTTSSPQPR